MDAIQINDKRALSLMIFHKLMHDLMEFNDDMTEKAAARIITDALHILPGFSVVRGEKNGIIYVKKEGDAATKDPRGVLVNIQDAIDSLIIIWEDYQKAGLSA